jgi:hypothetical protein
MRALAPDVAPLFAPASPVASNGATTDEEHGTVVALFRR